MAFPWNADGVEARLKKLWVEDGLTAAAIAADLSAMTGEPLTRNAVIGRINRLGLARNAVPPEPAPVEIPVEPEPEPEPVVPGAGVPLTALRIGQCKFPVTPHYALAHLFCAAAVEGPGATYCPEHAAICFDRRTPQERRAAQERAAKARAGKEAA